MIKYFSYDRLVRGEGRFRPFFFSRHFFKIVCMKSGLLVRNCDDKVVYLLPDETIRYDTKSKKISIASQPEYYRHPLRNVLSESGHSVYSLEYSHNVFDTFLDYSLSKYSALGLIFDDPVNEKSRFYTLTESRMGYYLHDDPALYRVKGVKILSQAIDENSSEKIRGRYTKLKARLEHDGMIILVNSNNHFEIVKVFLDVSFDQDYLVHNLSNVINHFDNFFIQNEFKLPSW